MTTRGLFVLALVAMLQQPASQAPLAVRQIQGQAKDRMGNAIPGVNLELDTTTSPARMLAIQVSGTDGRFDFGQKIPPGDYRLVATYPGLCTANIPIEINPKASRRKLALRMEYPGLDVCSYAVLK